MSKTARQNSILQKAQTRHKKPVRFLKPHGFYRFAHSHFIISRTLRFIVSV